MPYLQIASDSKLSESVVNRVKALGSILGYDDPRKIWVAVNDGLTQSDVMMVMVSVEKGDFEGPLFGMFCHQVARCLRDAVGKSVEVSVSIILSVSWCPTEAGALTYGIE